MQLELFPDYPRLPALAQPLPKKDWTKDWKRFAYPSEDNQPMAQNTVQGNIIIYLKSVMEAVVDSIQQDYIVAADMFVYFSKQVAKYKAGKKYFKTKKQVLAPDVFLATGIAQQKRDSFILEKEKELLAGKEENIRMIAVEVLSPANYKDKNDQVKRYNFYNELGVEEYIVIHTQHGLSIEAFWRIGGTLQRVLQYENYVINMLGLSLNIEGENVVARNLEGEVFLNYGNERENRLQAQALLKETKQILEGYTEEYRAAEEFMEAQALLIASETKRAEAEAKRAEEAERYALELQRKLNEMENLFKAQATY